jgi:hypothetical protein
MPNLIVRHLIGLKAMAEEMTYTIVLAISNQVSFCHIPYQTYRRTWLLIAKVLTYNCLETTTPTHVGHQTQNPHTCTSATWWNDESVKINSFDFYSVSWTLIVFQEGTHTFVSRQWESSIDIDIVYAQEWYLISSCQTGISNGLTLLWNLYLKFLIYFKVFKWGAYRVGQREIALP